MDQYSVEQLAKEWDDLFLGNGSDDLRDGADVYREFRKDLRALACALKQSFALVVDNRRFSTVGGGPSSVQQLQPCITELKSVAKEMVSATRMANDNYNLQVELTLQKHANQHLLAQLHAAQLARMALEEQITAIRAEAQRAAANEPSLESSLANQRRLNDELQAAVQHVSGELVEVRRLARELEAQLKAKNVEVEELSAKLQEMELLEEWGKHMQLGDLCGSSDGGTSDGGSLQQHHPHGADPGGGGSWATGANGCWAEGAASVDGAAEGPHGPGGRGHVHVRDLPLELRYLLGKVLRRRDVEAAKLREENSIMTEELARLQEALAAAKAAAASGVVTATPSGGEGLRQATPGAAAAGPACVSSASAPGLMQLGQRPTTPLRLSSDSWHTDDDFEWATRPVARLADAHPHAHSGSRLQGGDTGQSPQHFLPPGPSHRRQHHLHSRQQQQQQQQKVDGHSQHGGQQLEELREATAEAVALQAARETIARLTTELAEAKEHLQAEQAHAQAIAAQAQERLQAEQKASEAAGAQAQAAVAQAQAQLRAVQDSLDQSVLERESLEAQLQEVKRVAKAEAEAADAGAVAAAAAATSDAVRLTLENDRMAADLTSARQLVASLESQLAASASAHAELQGRLSDAEQRERQARDGAAKELEMVRQRLTRVQTDLREYRAEAQVARGEATAAWRDVKAANSEKLKAQREMEEAVERLRQAEAERSALAGRLAEAESQQRRLQEQLAEAERIAAAATAVAVVEAETQRAPQAGDDGRPEAMPEMLVLELQVARRELAQAEHRLVLERQVSEQEVRRLGAQLADLQAELAAARSELAAATVRLAQSETAAAEAQEQHSAETSQLRACLVEAQRRASEVQEQLDALRRVAMQELEAHKRSREDVRQEETEVRLRGLEEQLQAAEAKQRQAEQQHREELQALQARLADSQHAASAAGAADAADVSQGSSASSSDAGISGGGSPERVVAQEAATAGAGAHLAAGRVGQEAGYAGSAECEEEDGDDLNALRARCRALRGELALARSRLADLAAVAQAAAQGRLEVALADVKAAAATGRVSTDDDFWAHNSEVNSLHALVAALRATSLYAGPAGACGTYGDTRADGAGSVVAASSGHMAASRRRHMLLQYRERFGQMAELLAEAETLALLPPPAAPPQAQLSPHRSSHQYITRDRVVAAARAGRSQSLGSGPGCSSSGGGSAEGPHPQCRPAARNGGPGGPIDTPFPDAAASRASGLVATDSMPLIDLDLHSPYGVAAARTLAEAGRTPQSIYQLGSIGLFSSGDGGDGAGAAGSSSFGMVAAAGACDGTLTGTGMAGPTAPAPVASSSFTSDTGSSLADDDLTSLSHLYEIPPMTSPPKFDFSDMDFVKLTM